MASTEAFESENLLLRNLPEIEFDIISSHASAVVCESGQSLLQANDEISSILFIERGLVSVVGAAGRGRGMDLCLIGREGVVGSEALLEAGRTSQEHHVQLDAKALRVPLTALTSEAVPVLRRRLLRYIQTLLVQSYDAAISSGTSTIEVRLARWLLMCHDRIDGDEIQITHIALSKALGVRRAGITVALHMLEGERLIRSLRERIIIRDRLGLEQAAQGTYGHAEAQYERLLGPIVSPRSSHPAPAERLQPARPASLPAH
jgi:CRP-like cAMP-binding protein